MREAVEAVCDLAWQSGFGRWRRTSPLGRRARGRTERATVSVMEDCGGCVDVEVSVLRVVVRLPL